MDTTVALDIGLGSY